MKDIEFAGKGWSLFERFVRLKVKGQEVVVARIPQVPWSELSWVGKVTITDYLEQDW